MELSLEQFQVDAYSLPACSTRWTAIGRPVLPQLLAAASIANSSVALLCD